MARVPSANRATVQPRETTNETKQVTKRNSPNEEAAMRIGL